LSLSLRFLHQNPAYTSLPYVLHARPSHSSRFYHPNNIGWWVQIIKLLILLCSPFPCCLVPLRPKYSSQHSILKHPQPRFLPQYERPSFTLIQTTGKIIAKSVYLNLCIFR
jgi:hypothetical protein